MRVHVCEFLPACLSVCLLYINLCLYLPTYLPTFLLTYFSIRLSVCACIYNSRTYLYTRKCSHVHAYSIYALSISIFLCIFYSSIMKKKKTFIVYGRSDAQPKTRIDMTHQKLPLIHLAYYLFLCVYLFVSLSFM